MSKLLDTVKNALIETGDGTPTIRDEIEARHEENREAMRRKAGAMVTALSEVVGDTGPGIVDKYTSNSIHSGEHPVVNVDDREK